MLLSLSEVTQALNILISFVAIGSMTQNSASRNFPSALTYSSYLKVQDYILIVSVLKSTQIGVTG